MSGYLFDTNAISELFRRSPNAAYVEWLSSVPREEQFTSTVVVAELLAGACSSKTPALWLERYEKDVIGRVTVLPFDMDCARSRLVRGTDAEWREEISQTVAGGVWAAWR